MAEQITIRTRKNMRNGLLNRRQMVVDVIHPGQKPASRATIQAQLAKMFKADTQAVYVFGCKIKFGGGHTTGFAVVYDSVADAKKFEPRHRLMRQGLAEAKPAEKSRKVKKETKAKVIRTWGTGRRAALHKQKKNQ